MDDSSRGFVAQRPTRLAEEDVVEAGPVEGDRRGFQAGAVVSLPEIRGHEVPNPPGLEVGDVSLDALPGRDEDLPRIGVIRVPGNQQDHHTGSVELCLSPQYAERAFQDAHIERKAATAPFVDGTIPTTLDKQLAPEGVHVFSMFTQWVPDDWCREPHREELERYADRIVARYTELAPNFARSVIDRQVIGPHDMQRELGLVGGNIFHGELTVDQLFHMRPAPGFADYRTPVRGLYHASSATHAGGGVNGIPGWQAFRQARRDRRLGKGRQLPGAG